MRTAQPEPAASQLAVEPASPWVCSVKGLLMYTWVPMPYTPGGRLSVVLELCASSDQPTAGSDMAPSSTRHSAVSDDWVARSSTPGRPPSVPSVMSWSLPARFTRPSSPSLSSMPRTPRVSRPVGRTSSTEKRMLMPLAVPMSTSCLSVTTRAASSESPSSMPTPMMPVWRMFS